MILNTKYTPLDAIKVIKSSLTTVAPETDFIATINNSGSSPILESFKIVDRSHDWSAVSRRFARGQRELEAFPSTLAPICIVKIDPAIVTVLACDFTSNQPKITLGHKDEGKTPRIFSASAVSRITLDPVTANEALIPVHARQFCFLYPCTDPDVSWLMRGAFLYMDDDGHPIQLNELSKDHTRHILQYGLPLRLTEGVSQNLVPRCQKIHNTKFKRRGATHFCFISPGELIPPANSSFFSFGPPDEKPFVDTGHGGFAFLFETQPEFNRYFPILGSGGLAPQDM